MKVFSLDNNEGFLGNKNGVTWWHLAHLLPIWLGKRTLALVVSVLVLSLPTSSCEPQKVASDLLFLCVLSCMLCVVFLFFFLNLGNLWSLVIFSVVEDLSSTAQHELYPGKQTDHSASWSALAWVLGKTDACLLPGPLGLPATMCTYAWWKADSQVQLLVSFPLAIS